MKKNIFIYIIITILLTNGFWANFTPIPLVVDCACIPLFIYTLIYSDRGELNKKFNRIYWELIIYSIGLSVILLKDLVTDLTPRVCILGFRGYIELIFVGLAIERLISSKKDYSNTIKYITYFSTVLCCFGIIQYVFYDYLPDSLVHVYSGKIGYVYQDDTILYRPNALFSNGIVFNGIIIISSGLSLAFIIEEGLKIRYIICFLIAVTVNILTCARASNAGAILVYFTEYLLLNKRRFNFRRVLIVLFFGTALFAMTFASSETTIYKRMFDSSMTVQSDAVHTETINEAIETISNHPMLGIGIGTQGYDSTGSTIDKIVRDGWLYQFALEIGVPLTILFIIILLSFVFNAYKVMNTTDIPIVKVLCGSFISITAYFFFSGFINSSYNAKEVFGLYWIIAGLTLWEDIGCPEGANNKLLFEQDQRQEINSTL